MRQAQQPSHPSRMIERIENKLRTRDVVAIVIAIILTKMGINSSNNNGAMNLSASINLQWYIPRHIISSTSTAQQAQKQQRRRQKSNNNDIMLSSSSSQLTPVMLDIDGDGISEAIVTITERQKPQDNNTIVSKYAKKEWMVQVLDMKPIITTNRKKSTTPMIGNIYRPIVMFESDVISEETLKTSKTVITNDETEEGNLLKDGDINQHRLVPIDMITSHVVLRPEFMEMYRKDTIQQLEDVLANYKNVNRTLQFFCGTDWHDAATKCAVHCPSGQASDCPDGERCYADTPCTKMILPKQQQQQRGNRNNIYNTTTPAGGWPSVFTFWSHGAITMHSITIAPSSNTKSDADVVDSEKNKKTFHFGSKDQDGKKDKKKLQLKQMWTTIIPLNEGDDNNNTKKPRLFFGDSWSDWTDIAIHYVDAFEANNGAGLVIVTANAMTYVDVQHNEEESEEKLVMKKIILALNCEDGTIVWESIENGSIEKHGAFIPDSHNKLAGTTNAGGVDPLLNIMMQRGSQSTARRRSRIPGLSTGQELLLVYNTTSKSDLDSNKRRIMMGNQHANCLKEYRYSILTSSALPHSYFGEEDTRMHTLHFEHQGGGGKNKKGRQTIDGAKNKQLSSIGRRRTVGTGSGAASEGRDRKRRQRGRRPGRRRSRKAAAKELVDPKKWTLFSSSNKKKLSTSDEKQPLRFGRPNVVVVHDAAGIQVKSLKNGRTLCHLSLAPELVYDDINHDGTIDVLSAVVGNEHLYQDDDDEVDTDKKKEGADEPWNDAITSTKDQKKWVKELVDRIQINTMDSESNEKKKSVKSDEEGEAEKAFDGIKSSLCQLLALSGIPAKDELFSINLCKDRKSRNIAAQRRHHYGLQGSPPLLVETLQRNSRYFGTHDIVTALNNGIITRVRGYNGKIEWQTTVNSGSLSYWSESGSTPDWDHPSLVSLQRIRVQNALNDYTDDDDNDDAATIAPAHRPILWTGEDNMVLLSSSTGTIMAYSEFPQAIMTKPIVTDFNGDGTSDVIIVTTDAVWGYQVKINASTSILFRMIWGILFICVLLAFLRNQMQQQPGKRSTDA